VGVACNKFLAKLASDMEKPDGLTIVPSGEEEIRAFLAPLPVRRIWGVGKATGGRLLKHGIRTIGQVQTMTPAEVARLLGPSAGYHIWRLAQGRDDRDVQPGPREEKSLSHEETFPEDCGDWGILRQTLIELVEKVGRRLRRSGRRAAVAQIKVRYHDFQTITRQRRFGKPVDSDRELLDCALSLLEAEGIDEPLRLIGFGVSQLCSDSSSHDADQLLLFAEGETADPRDTELDRAVDAIRDRYGTSSLRRGDWTR